MRCYICDYSVGSPSDYNQEESAKQTRRMMRDNEGRSICTLCKAKSIDYDNRWGFTNKDEAKDQARREATYQAAAKELFPDVD